MTLVVRQSIDVLKARETATQTHTVQGAYDVEVTTVRHNLVGREKIGNMVTTAALSQVRHTYFRL